MAEIDLRDSGSIVHFGSRAQTELQNISQEMLADVKNKDVGPAGESLREIVTTIRGFSVTELDVRRNRSWWEKLMGRTAPFAKFVANYEKVQGQIDRVTIELDQHQHRLLKDIKSLDLLYDRTLNFYDELALYIAAGEEKLTQIDRDDIPAREAAVEAAAEADKDIFVLVRTSNPSSSELQMLDLADGTKVYEHVADLVEGWGAETIGSHGYSRVGAVVGATHPEEGKALRERMPHTFFLVPGYGAQGGTAADVAGMFDKQGSGAIVNSSRGIIGAWKKSGKYSESMTADEALDLVASSARQAALDMRDNLRVAVYR